MATCTHASRAVMSTMTKKTAIENRKTVNAQPASIIMNSASAAASPRRQGHQPTVHHAAHIHPERPPCWQCVQSNPKPCCQPCGFLLVILFPNPSFSCVNIRPFLWSVAAETRYEAEITETAKHTASESKTNHASNACTHPVKLRGIASRPVSKFRSQRIQP